MNSSSIRPVCPGETGKVARPRACCGPASVSAMMRLSLQTKTPAYSEAHGGDSTQWPIATNPTAHVEKRYTRLDNESDQETLSLLDEECRFDAKPW